MTTSAARPASSDPAPGSSQAGAWLSGLESLVAGWRARLAPADPVLVLHADGSQSVWLGDQKLQITPGAKPPAFVAVEIPDDLLLHRTLDLPRLSQQDVEQAILLEVRGSSPFAPGRRACLPSPCSAPPSPNTRRSFAARRSVVWCL